MLMFLVILGFGLLIAGIYKAMDDSNTRNAKLDRVQRKIALLEAEQAAKDKDVFDTEMKDPS